MVVSIRLARHGRIHSPFYRVVVADSKYPRDGRNLEVVGYYNPIAAKDDEKQLSIKLERVKYWLSVGAQPSERVKSLLFHSGLPLKRKGYYPEQPVDADANANEADGISPEAVLSIGLQV